MAVTASADDDGGYVADEYLLSIKKMQAQRERWKSCWSAALTVMHTSTAASPSSPASLCSAQDKGTGSTAEAEARQASLNFSDVRDIALCSDYCC